MRLVYYSLVREENSKYDKQWAQSVRSLRARNSYIAVTLFLFGTESEWIRREAERWQVQLIYLGSYRDWLQGYHQRGSVLSLYPTLHKFLVLSEADTTGLTQALYVDCDTFFFSDPAILFDALGPHHWSARESPTSRLCPHGYDPSNVNEELIEQIVSIEGLHWVQPFNAGVCLLNNGIWETFRQLRSIFFETVWRLMLGCHWVRNSGDYRIQHAMSAAAGPHDLPRALPYPSCNSWILEEIALWLTLGHVHNLAQSFLNRHLVMQGWETIHAAERGNVPTLAHYFSCFQQDFFKNVGALD